MMSESWRSRVLSIWREWVKPIIIILVVCGSFRSAIADWNDVPTGSMKPTIVEGDRIFVNKLAYGLRIPFTNWYVFEREGPARGDIVIFLSPEDGTRLVKRVVGLPGDRIEIRNNRVVVNDKPAAYEPLDSEIVAAIEPAERGNHRFAQERIDEQAHPVMTTPRRPSRATTEPIVVPEGEYFVLGDNRDLSRDSRWIGCIPRERIVGRATSVMLSVDSENHYLPRWHRFFRSLP